LSSGSNSLMEPTLQDFPGRQFRQVLGDSNTAALELKQFDMLVGLAGTENETQWRFFSNLTFVLFEPAEVEFHLPPIGGTRP
jgi:hypothetical protein